MPGKFHALRSATKKILIRISSSHSLQSHLHSDGEFSQPLRDQCSTKIVTSIPTVIDKCREYSDFKQKRSKQNRAKKTWHEHKAFNKVYLFLNIIKLQLYKLDYNK